MRTVNNLNQEQENTSHACKQGNESKVKNWLNHLEPLNSDSDNDPAKLAGSCQDSMTDDGWTSADDIYRLERHEPLNSHGCATSYDEPDLLNQGPTHATSSPTNNDFIYLSSISGMSKGSWIPSHATGISESLISGFSPPYRDILQDIQQSTTYDTAWSFTDYLESSANGSDAGTDHTAVPPNTDSKNSHGFFPKPDSSRDSGGNTNAKSPPPRTQSRANNSSGLRIIPSWSIGVSIGPSLGVRFNVSLGF